MSPSWTLLLSLWEFLLRPLQLTCRTLAKLLLELKATGFSHPSCRSSEVYLPSTTRTNASSVWEGCHALTPRGREAEVTAYTTNPVDIVGPTPGKARKELGL